MSAPELAISIGLIIQDDESHYVLQRRSSKTMSGAVGLIGAFGGKIEPHETPIDAVVREIGEETTLSPKASDFHWIGNVRVASDYNHKDIDINASVFILFLKADEECQAKEGEIVVFTKEEALQNRELLTPATRAVFDRIINTEK